MAILAVSDTHSFFRPTLSALESTGILYRKDTKVALLGDMLDRGEDTDELVNFFLGLHDEGRLIYIRGNHEDLLESALADIEEGHPGAVLSRDSHHFRNKTVKTMLHLSGMSYVEAMLKPHELTFRVKASEYYTRLLPAAIDYYETETHILTHGWIPCLSEKTPIGHHYMKHPDWRRATPEEWRRARWNNGMRLATEFGILEPGKTVVCGHFNASFAHAFIECRSTEFGVGADHSPYYGDGIIAIDGCVADSGRVNCIVIDG